MDNFDIEGQLSPSIPVENLDDMDTQNEEK